MVINKEIGFSDSSLEVVNAIPKSFRIQPKLANKLATIYLRRDDAIDEDEDVSMAIISHCNDERNSVQLALRYMKLSNGNFDKIEKRHELSLPYLGYLGISLNSECYEEVTVNKEPLSIETALEIARTELEEKISGELLGGSKMIGSELSYEYINNETIHVKLNMNFIENIGVETLIEE